MDRLGQASMNGPLENKYKQCYKCKEAWHLNHANRETGLKGKFRTLLDCRKNQEMQLMQELEEIERQKKIDWKKSKIGKKYKQRFARNTCTDLQEVEKRQE